LKELEGFGEIEQLAGDQYRGWGINQKNWEINYTHSGGMLIDHPPGNVCPSTKFALMHI